MALFVVSDMHRITTQHTRVQELAPDGLPVLLPAWQRGQFPYNQPIVFRSPGGRYFVLDQCHHTCQGTAVTA